MMNVTTTNTTIATAATATILVHDHQLGETLFDVIGHTSSIMATWLVIVQAQITALISHEGITVRCKQEHLVVQCCTELVLQCQQMVDHDCLCLLCTGGLIGHARIVTPTAHQQLNHHESK